MCYLWGCGLSVSRTPGAVQAQSLVGGGRRAGAERPRPAAPLAGAAGHLLPRWAGDGGWRQGSARRAARPRPPPCPARPPPSPARPPPGPPGPPPGAARRWMAGGAARPPRPSPLAGAVPLCLRASSSPLPLRAGRGREGGGDCGDGGRRCGWPAALPGISLAAGSGQGLILSNAIESVQP